MPTGQLPEDNRSKACRIQEDHAQIKFRQGATHKANLLAERNSNSDAQALRPNFELDVQGTKGKILAHDVKSPCLVFP